MSIRVVFMGTPDFAVASLEAILKSEIEVVGVVTAPDKPAGRGKKIQSSAVKKYAVENNMGPILQPFKFKDPKFLNELKSLNADLFVVVAFRMLPEVVWDMPKWGTINLHASLLPEYRGAAPINWAVINGDKKTGATTFFIEREIDTGKIIKQLEVAISENDTAGSLHDKLMLQGAELLVNTIKAIELGNAEAIIQNKLIDEAALKPAPKIFKEDCKINWNQTTLSVYNLIRGLSPYPAAWTELTDNTGNLISLKIFDAKPEYISPNQKAGSVDYSVSGEMKIACTDGYINVLSLQQAGKKRIDTKSFLLGFNQKGSFTLTT
jgi:methionyl-tRNA formyltransferase